MKSNLCSLLILIFAFIFANAQYAAAAGNVDGELLTVEKEDLSGPINIQLGVRVDYQRDYRNGDAFEDNCGFKGKYLMFDISGNITDKFSYVYRQRLNAIHTNANFFDGTDQLKLMYRFDKRWDVTAGKMSMAFGSMEYQYDPLEMYMYSEWGGSIPCYKFGVSLGCNITPNDRVVLQFHESPFDKRHMDLYAYTVAWYGNHNWFKTVYSANVLEYMPGKFIYYLALGNKFDFDHVTVDFEYSNRATANHTVFFKDFSIVGQVAWHPNSRWNFYGKATYGKNDTGDAADECVVDGTDITQVGAGVEFCPIRNYDKLRIHAAYGYSFGKNGKEESELQDDRHYVSVGLLWRMDIVKIVKDIWTAAKKK